MKNYILYHGNCYDGFGSAYSAWKKFGDAATYIPVTYGNPMPSLPEDAHVYLLDFSYPAKEILDLCEQVKSVTILDHHKTAEAALKDLHHPVLSINFNMAKSGALLSWLHFHPGKEVPELIKYISDRDLWTFTLPNSAEVHEGLVSYPMDFKVWDDLNIDTLKSEGKACHRLYKKLVDDICAKAYIKNMAGHDIPVVNTSIAWSEVGNRLLELYSGAKFAASFTVEENTVMWSLRSRKDFDVSEIAKKFGGGGHAQASGFKAQRN